VVEEQGVNSRTSGLLLILIAMMTALGVTAARSDTVAATDVVAPLVVTPIASPNPVLGADDLQHLAYEFTLMSFASSAVTIKKVETLDAATNDVIGTLDGDALAKMLRLNSGIKGGELGAGGSGILFMDVTLAKDASVPAKLLHRFTLSVANPPKADASGDHDPTPEHAQEVVFTTDPLPVGPAAVVVAPPLKGPRWAVGGGCCSPPSYHRSATLPINGAIHVAERFAIDFVQLNDKDKLFTGDMLKVSDYEYFGDKIYSVADGTVVGIQEGLPEQIPGRLPEDATIQMAGGNYTVVDIGNGRFAFYAHMQPGSLKVKLGDRIKTGDVIGLLGNTGNTDTPHLHFHVMDGPSPLLSNGLPYAFTSFTGQGRITDEQPLFTGGVSDVDSAVWAGPHKNELPLNLEVVSFP
jgi:hypothetical protein